MLGKLSFLSFYIFGVKVNERTLDLNLGLWDNYYFSLIRILKQTEKCLQEVDTVFSETPE